MRDKIHVKHTHKQIHKQRPPTTTKTKQHKQKLNIRNRKNGGKQPKRFEDPWIIDYL